MRSPSRPGLLSTDSRRTLIGVGSAVGLGLALLMGPPGLAGQVVTDMSLAGQVHFDGAAAYDNSGYQIDAAGDVNNDGYDDVLIGASAADNNDRQSSGSAFVVFGRATPVTVDLASLGTAGFRIDGALAQDYSANAVAGAGDVNNDGYDDVLVGAQDAEYNGRTGSGVSYLVFGGPNPVNVDLANLGTRGIQINGAAHDGCGSEVAGAGDVNNDGYDDMLIGAGWAGYNSRTSSGSTYVVYGSPSPTTVDLAGLGTAGFRIDGASDQDSSAWSVAGAGDINNDGYDDVAIGAPFTDNNGRAVSGSTYVVFGGATRNTTLDLATPGTAGIRIDGAVIAEESGVAVAGAGDVNKDGYGDVLIGAPFGDRNSRTESGTSYVVYGSATPGNVDLAALGNGGFRIEGETRYDSSGWSVAGAGDANKDGYGDVLIGAPAIYVGSPTGYQGFTYLVYGGATPATIDLASLGSGGLRMDGIYGHDASGMDVAGAGDVNNDGGADVIIGAPYADYHGRDGSGATYLVLGSSDTTPTPTPSVTPTPTPSTAQTPAATLTVKARKAGKAVPKTGKTTLVKKVTVGPGQAAAISVKVKPKKTKKKVKVSKTATTVKVRTKKAPKGKVTVKITASGAGFTPTTWKRTWKVR